MLDTSSLESTAAAIRTSKTADLPGPPSGSVSPMDLE